EVAGAAFQVDHDDGLVRGLGVLRSLGAQAQQVRQAQAAHAEGAGDEEVAPRDAVAQGIGLATPDRQHVGSSYTNAGRKVGPLQVAVRAGISVLTVYWRTGRGASIFFRRNRAASGVAGFARIQPVSPLNSGEFSYNGQVLSPLIVSVSTIS